MKSLVTTFVGLLTAALAVACAAEPQAHKQGAARAKPAAEKSAAEDETGSAASSNQSKAMFLAEIDEIPEGSSYYQDGVRRETLCDEDCRLFRAVGDDGEERVIAVTARELMLDESEAKDEGSEDGLGLWAPGAIAARIAGGIAVVTGAQGGYVATGGGVSVGRRPNGSGYIASRGGLYAFGPRGRVAATAGGVVAQGANGGFVAVRPGAAVVLGPRGAGVAITPRGALVRDQSGKVSVVDRAGNYVSVAPNGAVSSGNVVANGGLKLTEGAEMVSTFQSPWGRCALLDEGAICHTTGE